VQVDSGVGPKTPECSSTPESRSETTPESFFTPESFLQRMLGVGGGSEGNPGVPSAGVGDGVDEPSDGTSAIGLPSAPRSHVFCRGGRNGASAS